jgi:DNA-binding response OmpR family regulator
MDVLFNKKILVVDDEVELLEIIEHALKLEGFTHVKTTNTGVKALEDFHSWQPDIVILDVMLPDIQGHNLCKTMRETSQVPIIFVSAKTEEVDRIVGFAIGADDYVTKPFSPKELAYRVKAHLKRSEPTVKTQDIETIDFGPFKMIPLKGELFKEDEALVLQPKAYKLLEYFAKHPNLILSKEHLCDAVWGEDYIGFDNTIMVHIRRIREQIEVDPSNPKYLITVKGLGYKLVVKDK